MEELDLRQVGVRCWVPQIVIGEFDRRYRMSEPNPDHVQSLVPRLEEKMRFADSIKPKCTSNRHNDCLVLSQYKFYGMAIPPLNLHFMRPLTTLFHDKSSNKKQTACNNRSAVLINFFGSFSRWLQGINQRVN